ncbi:MAG: DUF2937 domain-containing protein [Hyphomicrobiales bacterium]|nr:MAG: DUF2937 domain-containing protein [Hyphomicrobiales bacterium]
MVGRILTLAFGALFAALFSQVPEYAQQYRQRLGGAIDELAKIVEVFDADVLKQGLQRTEALARLRANSDPIAAQRGERMGETVERLDRLKHQNDVMEDAGAFTRVTALAKDFDSEIGVAAYEDFEPAVPLTIEGLVAAAIGFVLALFGGGATRAAVGAVRKRRRGRLEPSDQIPDA